METEVADRLHLKALRDADAAARRAALDPTRSFIVQAPAGSGKTELLIQRYLALLARVEVPEEVLAITFTRKATAEMRARVLGALAAPPEDPLPERVHERVTRELARAVRDRDREAGWHIADNPNRLRIQTIDSLCHGLTARLPIASGFGAQPETLEDARELYEEAARRTLAGLDTPDPWSKDVAVLLRHLDNHVGRAVELLSGMLRVRDQWIRSIPRARGMERAQLEEALANATRDALSALVRLFPAGLRAELAILARYAAANLEAAGQNSPIRRLGAMTELPGASVDDLESWKAIAELLLTQSGTVRAASGARIGFPAAGGASGPERERRRQMKARFEALVKALAPHRTLIEQLHFTRVLPPPSYSDEQWRIVAALVTLLPVAVAQLEVLFRERGQVDFTAVAQAAVGALGAPDAPTDLALALDYRIRHILVDEFQDTSWSQYELLAGLTIGWQPGDGRTLFVVGDPMQSIYRFRQAEVALYMKAWREGIGGVALEPLRLAVNFRSSGALVDWFNSVFREVLADEDDLASGAVRFVESVPENDASDGVPPRFYPLLVSDREPEARLVAELAAQARAERPDQDIAILVRSRAHLAAIAPELKKAGLPFQAIEIEELGHRTIVRDLLALTRALIHPADRVAWLAVLRAPWCGLTLADFTALASNDHSRTLWTLMNDEQVCARLTPDGQARVARVRGVLERAIADRRREPLRRWVEAAWLALGGPACAEKASELEDAEVFLKLLEELERGGDLPSLETLEERVAALYSAPDPDAAAARLQLMTIHKAKGLQFDTVIVPGLGHPPRRDEPRLLLWMERPRERAAPDLLLAPIREAGAEKDPVYDYVKELERAKGEHEAARLLYVAATRAKSRLHLIGQIDAANGKILKPRAGSLLEHLWPVVAPAFEEALRDSSGEPLPSSGEEPRPDVIRRIVSGWCLPDLPPGLAWKAPSGPVYVARSPHDEVEFSWASESAKHVGTVVHRFLQFIAAEGPERWTPQRIDALDAVYARDLARLGVPQTEMAEAVARVAAALRGTLADPRGRWLLAPHTEAQSELRLTALLDGEVASIAMDRTFVDENGVRWIVDFKTGTHEGGDPEGFLDREKERYRAQLERYARIMRAHDARPVRLGLYFPLLQGWREWEA